MGRSSGRFRGCCLGNSFPRWFSRGILFGCRLRSFLSFRLGLAPVLGGGEGMELICVKVCLEGLVWLGLVLFSWPGLMKIRYFF